MDVDKYCQGPCPIGRALALVGDAWSMLVLRDAGLGVTRFEQFRVSLGIAPNILTKRLKALTDAGLLARTTYSQKPPREEYVITEAGRDFLPVLHAIGAWGRRHNGGGALGYVVDAQTGVMIEPVVIDRVNGAPIGTRKLRVVRPEDPPGQSSGQGGPSPLRADAGRARRARTQPPPSGPVI